MEQALARSQYRARGHGAPTEPVSPARIVIADDHDVVRHGVRQVLAHAAAPGYTVVAEVGHVPGALHAVQRLRPDLLLVDVSMPSG